MPNKLHVVNSGPSGELRSGVYVVIVEGHAPEVDIDIPGVPFINGEMTSDGLIAFSSTKESSDKLNLRAPPVGCVAILSNNQAKASEFAEHWSGLTGQAPPALCANKASAVINEILGQVVSQLQVVAKHAAQTALALAQMRQEYEETRQRFAEMVVSIGYNPPKQLTLQRELAVGTDGASISLWDDNRPLLQHTGLSVTAAARIGIWVRDPAPSDGVPKVGSSSLRVRALAAESNRVVGSWRIPSTELVEGWLFLDFPTPVWDLRETLLIDCRTHEVEANRPIMLGLTAPAVLPELAAVHDAEWGGARSLAFQIYTAPPASRFVYPAYWEWRGVYLAPGSERAPLLIPIEVNGSVQRLGGDARVSIDPVGSILFAHGGGDNRAVLAVRKIDFRDADILTVEIYASEGCRVAVWAVTGSDASMTVELPEQLASANVVFSGWRDVPANQLLPLGLPVPIDTRELGSIVIAVNLPGAERASVAVGPFRLTISESALSRPLELTAAEVPDTTEVSVGDAAPTLAAVLNARQITAVEYFVTTGYEHVSIQLTEVRFGTMNLGTLAFKLFLSGGRHGLEFRQVANQHPFTKWPGVKDDNFGPVFSLAVNVGDPVLLPEGLPPRDHALLSALIDALPRLLSRLEVKTHNPIPHDRLEAVLQAAISLSRAGVAVQEGRPDGVRKGKSQ